MPSLKRKPSDTFRPPPITPRTSKLRPGSQIHQTSAPSTSQRGPFHPPSSSVPRQLRTPFQTETHIEINDTESFPDDNLGHIIVAFDLKDYGTVGCSYYSAEEEKIYMLGDSRSGGMGTIEACTFDGSTVRNEYEQTRFLTINSDYPDQTHCDLDFRAS